MRPRFHVLLTPDDHIAISKWWQRMGGAAALLLLAAIAWPILNSHLDRGIAANASGRSIDPTCNAWDTRAGEAIAIFVQGSKHDINVAHVSNMIDKVRSARRNCQLGFANLACENYLAVVHGVAASFESTSDISIDCEAVTSVNLEATVGITTSR